jgi:hypothetical protein
MKVWIMSIGYDYEGEDVQSVHVTKAGAIAAAEREMAQDDRTWSSPDQRSDSVIVWEGGAKYINVVGYEVNPDDEPTEETP